MELNMIGLASTAIAVAAGTYSLFFGVIRNFNEWYFCSVKKKFKSPLPPGDMGWPVFGNMKTYLNAYKNQDPDSYTFDLVKRYGETGVYKAHLFGKPHAVVITPETSKTVLVDEEKFKLGYPSLIELAGKKSLLCVAGNEHKRLRKLAMSPINGFEPLSLYIGLIEEAVTVNLEKWANNDKPVELIHELIGNTFTVVTNIFFGPGGHEKFGHMRSSFADLVNGLYVVGINLPGFAYHKAFKARQKIVSIVDDAIEETRKMNKDGESKEKSSMLDFLLEVEDENGGKFDNESIIDLLAGIVFAGHESTAFATMWVVLYLRQNPQVAQKVKEEQEEIVKNRPPTQKGLSMKEIKQMNYTVKVVNETLRMANLGFGVFRESTEDTEINGYAIPKGWKILVMMRHIHMDPKFIQTLKNMILQDLTIQKPLGLSFHLD